jgi:hypothetical protein
MHISNISLLLQDYMALYPRRLSSYFQIWYCKVFVLVHANKGSLLCSNESIKLMVEVQL